MGKLPLFIDPNKWENTIPVRYALMISTEENLICHFIMSKNSQRELILHGDIGASFIVASSSL